MQAQFSRLIRKKYNTNFIYLPVTMNHFWQKNLLGNPDLTCELALSGVHATHVLLQVANLEPHVVVVYHVTIVAIGHRLLKKFWPLVIGCVLRTTGSSII